MINDWRFHFQQGDFPFIQVQLANYREPASFDKNSSWALLRDSQDKLCRRMKNVYMSTAIDIGDTWDIHPQDKKTIGKRLADNALCNVYGKNCVVPNGPLLRKAVRENDAAVRLIFDYADGIYFPNGSPESLGFFICDEKNVFTPVDNVILDGNSLIVSCKAIKNPVKVCYSWSDNPDGNLRNGAGLPAHPFMVDTEY
jgi:sialate O-acetylesterase